MSRAFRPGEILARAVDRRAFLRTFSVAAFGVAAAWAAGFPRPDAALANECQTTSSGCNCTPLNSTYCFSLNAGYCSGAICASPCSYYYGVYSSTACWCTLTCCYNGGCTSGYYKCCDCSCPGSTCTCREFVTTCTTLGPQPARSTGGLRPNCVPDCC